MCDPNAGGDAVNVNEVICFTHHGQGKELRIEARSMRSGRMFSASRLLSVEELAAFIGGRDVLVGLVERELTEQIRLAALEVPRER
jgi:hypothetical protein